ncbi:hypothetical protein J2Z32_003341 [Paenibacillus turicensis]|uniref:F5/8 type C domain-containing protein n=1 Tax=Paenibacillus turicensis TaxID=160487 RepID=A0ABS4FVR9_9BACL|nr:hypothetical protein [Paenibacillus turicensis]MBP1906677.1 hypothetical protein [Paenibacillus turicensis]
MATIGQQLLHPEQGWNRYDDRDSNIKYSGTWTKATNSALLFQTESYSNVIGSNLSFKFLGTGIRIISSLNTNRSSNIEVSLDGNKEIISMYRSSVLNHVVTFEKLDLVNTEHEIVVTLNDSSGYIQIDAIDIDSTGRLIHPDEVTDIKDIEIGKRIRCHYQATTANTVGTFSGLGQETLDFIPVTSSNVPNGDFNWICVDEYNKKKILIADRNIQHSISWDTLNSDGIASGSGLPVNWIDNSRYKTAIRLPTGGINSSDKDNEWDKYIVSSTLNGSIVAGDNNVWNWSGKWSLTSTTTPASSSNRVVRGYNNPSGYSYIPSSQVDPFNQNFRPFLVIEDILKTYTFIKTNNQYKSFKNNQWNNISTTLPSQSTFISDGMQNLAILDRKETKFTQKMSNNGTLGEGKVFKSTIDLKKLFEIESIKVMTKTPTYGTETAIPQMTSNTTPNGRAFASSVSSTNNEPWRAFDRLVNVFSTSEGSGGVGHLGYEFVNPIKIGKYAVRSQNSTDVTRNPKDWTFEGSNDGTNWTVLDTQDNQIWTSANTDKKYIIDNSKVNNYKMYRLNWTANGGYSGYTFINELSMFEVSYEWT